MPDLGEEAKEMGEAKLGLLPPQTSTLGFVPYASEKEGRKVKDQSDFMEPWRQVNT